jgi:DNA polymerase elongation subunit (family B)
VEPKILFYDIETAPNLAYVWGHYQQDVIQHEREWYMLCFAWRWGHQKTVHACALPDFPKAYAKNPEDDFNVVKKLHELFDEADIIVAHNGDSFDYKKANARFVKHGLGPTSPVASIDTLKVARKHFKFTTNHLNSLGKYLDIGVKTDTGGFKTWAGCMRGNPAAWKTMVKYNKQDINLLYDVYMALRPWMSNHPNWNMYTEENGCPTCGHKKVHRRGYRRTRTMTYVQFKCQRCGAFSRQRVAEKDYRPGIV